MIIREYGRKAERQGKQTRGLRRELRSTGVCAAHDHRQLGQGRIGQLVALQKGIETAEFPPILATGAIEDRRVFALVVQTLILPGHQLCRENNNVVPYNNVTRITPQGYSEARESAAIELHRRRLDFEIIREPSQFFIARASPCPLSSWRSGKCAMAKFAHLIEKIALYGALGQLT
jgi:hypothetical protein